MLPTTEFLWTLVEQQPDDVGLRCHFAQALLDETAWQPAMEAASEAIRQDASFVEAWLTRATALQALGRWADAARDLEHAAQLAPLRASILVGLATCCAELDRLPEAEHWLNLAVALEPHSKEAQANLGSILVRLDKLADAERPCRAALAIDETTISAHQNLSVILADRDEQAARSHRNSAYQRQQVFIEPALREQQAVLVLAAADAANVPLRHLLPKCRFTIIRWYIEYAPPRQFNTLPRFDLVFNSIGDADFIPALSSDTAEALEELGTKLLNPFARVALTARDHLADLLRNIPNVLVPTTIRVGSASAQAEPATELEHHPTGRDQLSDKDARQNKELELSSDPLRSGKALGGPVLLRPVGSHGGVGVVKLAKLGDAAVSPEPGSFVTEYVDSQAADGWYRKYRAIFVGGKAFPYHLAISPQWLVHYWTAGMDCDPRRRAEESAFLDNPAEAIGNNAWAAIMAIGQRLGLDYGGIDFGILPDGRVLVFEANATMLVHPERDVMFAYRRPAIAAIQQAFAQLIQERSV